MHDTQAAAPFLAADCVLVRAGLLAGLPLAACQTGPTGEVATIDVAQGSEQNISSLTAVIKRNPRDPEAYNVRGSAYGRGGDYREALRDFDTAIELNPSFYQAYSNRALIHRFTWRSGRRAGRLQSRHPDQFQLRRRLYRPRRPLPQGRPHQDAFNDFQRAIQLDTTDAARLPPSRADLSGAGPALIRDRGFLDRDLAVAGFARAIQWPRRLLSRAERRG